MRSGGTTESHFRLFGIAYRVDEHEVGEAHVFHGPRNRTDITRVGGIDENDTDPRQHSAIRSQAKNGILSN